jgi:glycosyltransferase involved in cell wall biosynthesis
MKIVWIKTELLHPVNSGGRIRTHAMLRELTRSHEITYVCLEGSGDAEALAKASEYCHRVVPWSVAWAGRGTPAYFVELLGSLIGSSQPFALSRYSIDGFGDLIARTVRDVRPDVVVCDFLAPAANVRRQGDERLVLFQHNVESLIWRRHEQLRRGRLTGWFWTLQRRRMERWERELCARFDHVIAVSSDDAQILAEQFSVHSVSAVPTGVDTTFFAPRPHVARRTKRLVFTGAMDWMPNIDGIQWFHDACLPRVRARIPDVELQIVGRDPVPSIRALHDPATKVTVTGTVPDIREYLAEAGVVVVPLRVGGGTRLKVYEALAMNCPMVSTTIGAEGLPLTDGAHLKIADDATALADAIVDCLLDAEGAQMMGNAGGSFVRERFGWPAVAAEFARQCQAPARRDDFR